jgi:hypothetical protein
MKSRAVKGDGTAVSDRVVWVGLYSSTMAMESCKVRFPCRFPWEYILGRGNRQGKDSELERAYRRGLRGSRGSLQFL